MSNRPSQYQHSQTQQQFMSSERYSFQLQSPNSQGEFVEMDNKKLSPQASLQHIKSERNSVFSSSKKVKKVSLFQILHIEKFKSTEKYEEIEESEKKGEEYNGLTIPADWELARKHALARSVGLPIESQEQENCPCCGYEVNRKLLNYLGSTRQLSFLGSGFPLFYNFIQYCIIILFAFFVCQGGFNLVTNIQGDFCNDVNRNQKGQRCPDTWIHKASLANKIDHPDLIDKSANLNLLILIVVSTILFYFRKSQRQIDKQIDEELCTPADYTLMVKNIPKGMNLNYKVELEKIFTYYAIPDSDQQIVVTKVVLVFDISELIEREDELKEIVQQKQKQLLKCKMNYQDPEVKKFDKLIEETEEKIEKLEEEIQHDGEKFSGIAFISFLTEDMKDIVLSNNQHTWQDRVKAHFNKGRSDNLVQDDLSWMDQKLFLEPAPEPNDVDWEFVHVKTNQKIKWRIISWSISFGFMITCFALIYLLSNWSDSLNDWAEDHEETIDSWTTLKINLISGSISWIIVLFNKFIMGFTYHHIVDSERISSKTKFNIQFAFKLTIALFINTAMMSYIIDIILMGNVITKGGFIQNETQVFILNAFFPPIVWFVDPYHLLKLYQRNRELKRKEQNISVVTQQEANFLMEHTEYYQAKRYADIMKTMWFTFLFGNVIPLGIILSIIGLSCYFWIDKYNVMRRRTVKENLSKEVSIEMIEMLELTVIFCGIGNMTMSYEFFGTIQWQDVVVCLAGLVFAIVPMQDINNLVFEIEDHPETKTYDKVCFHFVTDYDRENPVTKKQALETWMFHQRSHQQSPHVQKENF